ncbi:M28 family peptidase [Filimonas effusa]|uniref:M28 family peptidase n=1 Tax=Filimonas effusa TaxID=2508721 RepID=A0A4Q1D782_9BACT|nr:M28 family peptidase [Filimonas effusa]RXK83916.1 M28 family peptidase [Filimonas effusa]
MKKALLILVAFPVLTYAQSRKQKKAQAKADLEIVTNLRVHISYLADDKLGGRRAGSDGELLAMQYISEQFSKAGLVPRGVRAFEQPFQIRPGKQFSQGGNMLKVNDQALVPGEDFFPLPYSATATMEGSASPSLREKGEPWFWDLKEAFDENKDNPHFDALAAIHHEASIAARKGAKALFIINTGLPSNDVSFNKRDTLAAMTLPVVYITSAAAKRYFPDLTTSYALDLRVKIEDPVRTGHNVIGFINNNAAHTVILGAHYDHLGLGEDGNSLDGEGAIHNGADDNASGTAALLELARLLKSAAYKKNNYLFIAFSGEELGLLGSKYWLENHSADIVPNYMINMDMIGRYDSHRSLTIGGYGSSPQWGGLLKGITDHSLSIRFDSSGAGPSDHAAFYHKGVPVLFFFTNSHEDYHKASDDADKINYEGALSIVKYIQEVVAATDNAGKLSFARTKDPEVGSVNLPVTLGIMPDYAFTGTGVRVDGIGKGKLAERTGLKTGDIVFQLGDQRFTDVVSYMQTLRTFKKGDTTQLHIKRGQEEKVFDIQF